MGNESMRWYYAQKASVPNYWRNNEITSLQTKYFRVRSLFQELNEKPGSNDRKEAHRRRSKEAIRKNKSTASNSFATMPI